MTSLSRNEIFICYAHQDRKWREKLVMHLQPLVRRERITLWDDTHIAPGAQWRVELRRALARARIAVLLVSPQFLASDFITKYELPALLAAAERDGLTIIWVPISHSNYEETELRSYPLTLLLPVGNEQRQLETAPLSSRACA